MVPTSAQPIKAYRKKFNHFDCAGFSAIYTKFYFDSFRKGSKGGRKGPIMKRFMITMAKLFTKSQVTDRLIYFKTSILHIAIFSHILFLNHLFLRTTTLKGDVNETVFFINSKHSYWSFCHTTMHSFRLNSQPI